MEYINRDMEHLLRKLIKEYSCILVTGPRQVGKTTLLEHFDDCKRDAVTLDDLQERSMAKSDPELFLSMHKPPVIIDEVQYVPELFTYIKIAIDKGALPGSYLLTGSQSFRLMRLAQESLAGRVAVLDLPPLSQHELFNSERAFRPFRIPADSEELQDIQSLSPVADADEIFKRVWTGGLPAYSSGRYSNRSVYFSSYLQTFVLRDVSDELSLKDSVRFADFIRAAACRVGCELNVHSIALDVDVSDDTAKRWLDVLEKAQLIFYLHPYSNNLLKRTVKHPKLYFFDTGLVAYLTRYSSPEILQHGSINGEILKNYVVSEMRKSYMNAGEEPLMHYFRDKDGREIDVILEYDGKLHPIEIKKSSNPTLDMTKAFSVLAKAEADAGTGAVICLKDKACMLGKGVVALPISSL